jgi:hypothetical protein
MKMKKRFKYSLSNTKLLTCNMGELIPIGLYEVLPGDTIQQKTTALIRMSPLLAPVMHPVYTVIMSFYIPNRILFDDWEDFITGGEDGDDSTTFPTISFQQDIAAGDLADYFGLPLGISHTGINALPFRAYNAIYNEYFRNKDLQTALTIDTSDGVDSSTDTDLQNVLWEKDYFTAASPDPQLGDQVTLPLIQYQHDTTKYNYVRQKSDGSVDSSADDLSFYSTGVLTEKSGGISRHLDLSDTHYAGTINELREAIALQREAEARQIYGASYHEYLRYLGIQGHDSRLDRPEMLSLSRQIMNFSEVLQTGVDSGDSGVGNMGGHGITATRTNRFRRFIPEHGFIMSLMFVRPKTIYSEGLNKHWTRSTKEDFWNPNLEGIGMQEILNKEIYADHTTPEGTFAYTYRYQEYRDVPSTVAGDFRDGGNLDHWHMARFFDSDPAFNSTFVEANPTDRIYAATTEDQLYCQFHHSIQARRLVRPAGAPGLTRI